MPARKFLNDQLTQELIDDIKARLALKENTLSAAQRAAINSGITSTKVGQYDGVIALEAKDRAALAEVIDSGAKNGLEIAQGKESTYHCTATVNGRSLSIVSTGNWARASYPITLKPGKYVFSCNVTEVTGSARVRFYTDSSGQGGTAIVSDLIISSSGIKSTEITLDAETTFYVIYYSNYSSANEDSTLILSDNMICAQAAWDISQKYAPYRPSYDELIARVKALEGGT